MAEPLDTALRRAADRLGDGGVPSPRADAELLAAHVLAVSRGRVAALAVAGTALTPQSAAAFDELVEERGRRTPLQHLTGVAPFRQLELRVGPGVFIPRPETEQVAQIAIDHVRGLGSRDSPVRVVDLGTGSGALAAAIATECEQVEVHAVELSDQALAWARLNLEGLGVTLHKGDLTATPGSWDATFDVVVSNPPYIPEEMVPREREVREHDPHLALYGGGESGLEIPLAVIAAARRLLRPGGRLVMEHAEVQAEALRSHCHAAGGFGRVQTHRDLSGRDRALSAFADPAVDPDPSAAPSMEEWGP